MFVYDFTKKVDQQKNKRGTGEQQYDTVTTTNKYYGMGINGKNMLEQFRANIKDV